MDYTNLPHYQNIPGRQDAIDHAGKIDKEQFIISLSVLFGVAILSVVVRLVARIFAHVPWRLDDGLVITAAALLASGFATCLHNLDNIYLLEAINKDVVFPFQEDVSNILSILKWSTITTFLVTTSLYLVKFTFLCIFHTLVQGMPRRITRFFWLTVGLSVIFWIYTILGPVIICPHFGADAAECSTHPGQHTRSFVGNIIFAVVDITSDAMIITIPILVLNLSLMSTTRKLSLAAMLCLSVVMIVIALIRLIGTIADTRPDGDGVAPVWATYWSMVEGCVSLTMTDVIVIRAVFITKAIKEDRRMNDRRWSRAGRRLLSTLRLPGSSPSSKHSSPRHSNDGKKVDPNPPNIATEALRGNTFSSMNGFIIGGDGRHQDLDHAVGDGDMDYRLHDLEYNVVRKDFDVRPSGS
ncbi:hypothetical protein F5B18DRAFT_649488 [Nemania serpens]|nr:hypothetical protein F5B18DRAFT_649488 [Nemania serpens]